MSAATPLSTPADASDSALEFGRRLPTPVEDEFKSDETNDPPGLVGTFVWTLGRGERWVLGPESAFLFRDCWRQAIAREVWMIDERPRRWRDVLATVARRWVSGQPFLLDLYVAERDGAELGISSDQIGGNLYEVELDGPLLSRKSVYFGSQPGVVLRISSPLGEVARARGWRPLLDALQRAAYGPGWIFQRFEPREGSDRHRVLLQIDGDPYHRVLGAGESVRSDPRHAYAWDAGVSWRLVRFGSVFDRLLRGSAPFQVEFRGPGRLWLSNMSFEDGYLGSLFTPSHWVFGLGERVRKLLGLLNPAHWL